MLTRELVINNSQGLHARPATLLVQKATTFKCEVSIECNGKCANAKSLIGVLSLGVNKGYSVKLITNGTDEEIALEEITAVVQGL
ncbi:MAG: HPr family phosphocarrier protein [Clostridium sp.]|uniref:HPr family phosphocarrier protein n=1 Tax=Clostridium culturomicium TaxID=1499683 RepID=UPI00058BF965|nr:HPr family phosphocarrier protein [Clostridium culturomicium]MDU4889017.1 HPr family phosphocarrier protein [Clostridium sp.]MDU7083339.1 HPr family phosphocarrier protein [Clostridium sp.]